MVRAPTIFGTREMTKLAAAAEDACRRLLGEQSLEVEQPGGRSRDSVRVRLKDRSVIATRRKSAKRAELEVFVLRALGGEGAPVPAVLAYDGDWIVQEDLGPHRLSQVLARVQEAEAEVVLDSAMAGLAAVQLAGRAAGLHERVVVLGTKASWLAELIETPQRIGAHLGIAAPELPTAELSQMLAVGPPHFIKWDARPGNAIVRRDLSVAWFDWEHCGCRNRLDDLGWLLGDEYVPDWPEVEDRLLARHLPSFVEDGDAAFAEAYLRSFGTLHMCVRLALILSKKGEGPWWDAADCLAKDRVGVTAAAAVCTARRAARWASRAPLLEALAPWLEGVAENFARAP